MIVVLTCAINEEPFKDDKVVDLSVSLRHAVVLAQECHHLVGRHVDGKVLGLDALSLQHVVE